MIYPATIGIVGGGQLGKMLTIAAKKMGFFVVVTDPTPESPAGQVADRQIIGGYKDEKATRELAKLSDIITVEAEFVNDLVLQKIADNGKPVHPSPRTIGIIKDKLKQKEFLKKNKIPTADFVEIPSSHPGAQRAIGSQTKDSISRSRSFQNDSNNEILESIEKAIEKFGLPVMLKAREDAYDGKGNFVIHKKSDIEIGLKKLSGRSLYVEKFVPFKKELAVMVARSINGEIKTYPVVETKHVDSICDTVIAPAKISKKAEANAISLAKKTVELLNGVGIFGIEMFLKSDDSVLINEIAPRVHNSGHYTIEACVTSQFEQHVRAITGLPLGSTEMIVKSAVMKNILGTKVGIGFPKGLEDALKIPGVSYHLYNKKESRPGRKMGHLTVVGDSVEVCLQKVYKARELLKI